MDMYVVTTDIILWSKDKYKYNWKGDEGEQEKRLSKLIYSDHGVCSLRVQ
jgi:hypothetical protein